MILIVEDNPIDAKIIENFLHKSGYDEVKVARSAEEALSICQEEPPEIIVTDVHLPKMNGIELCKIIGSKSSPCCDIPFIIISSDDRKIHTMLTSLAVGAKRFFSKPVKQTAFVSAVHTCVEIANAQQAVQRANEKILNHLS